MNKGWLWDRRISEREAKKILANSQHPHFIPLASLLLSRKNLPREVLKGYLSPENFCNFWPQIKKRMRLDSWNEPRIESWQAIYEKVLERLKIKGFSLKRRVTSPDKFCQKIGGQIKALRLKKGMTQKDLAEKLHISQQIISRIEKGRQNVSLDTLKKITTKLGGKVEIKI